MADEDEFSHLKSRITEVKKLTSKYKNYPYVEDFMREWKVIFSYGTYTLEIEINFLPVTFGVTLRRSKVIRRRLLNLIRALEFLQLEPDLTPEKLKHVHKMIMQQEKHPNSNDYAYQRVQENTSFCRLQDVCSSKCNQMLMNNALHRYYSSDDDSIYAATKLFADMINIHPI